MKIKDYKLFLESKEDIDSICQKYDIRDYIINEDGTVDVDGHVSLFRKGLTKLPLKFGRVKSFDCRYNQLTTLDGAPYWVGHIFQCSDNELTTLEGGPVTVIDGYYCYDNNLVNFKGFPEDFDGDISITGNPVYHKLLKDKPQEKWNKFIYWCNEYDAIDDEGNVNEEWMEEVYQKLGLKYED